MDQNRQHKKMNGAEYWRKRVSHKTLYQRLERDLNECIRLMQFFAQRLYDRKEKDAVLYIAMELRRHSMKLRECSEYISDELQEIAEKQAERGDKAGSVYNAVMGEKHEKRA